MENQRSYFENQIAEIWKDYDNKIIQGKKTIDDLEEQIVAEDKQVVSTNQEVEELKEKYSEHKMEFQK